jgi:hypothetical protein
MNMRLEGLARQVRDRDKPAKRGHLEGVISLSEVMQQISPLIEATGADLRQERNEGGLLTLDIKGDLSPFIQAAMKKFAEKGGYDLFINKLPPDDE